MVNWYKKAYLVPTENITDDIYNAISDHNDGNWVVRNMRNMMLSYALQKYLIVELDGKDVIKQSDYFYVKVLIYIYRSIGVIHPWVGTYENAKDWKDVDPLSLKDFISQHPGITPEQAIEEETKRFKAIKELTPGNAVYYDTEYGNKLIELHTVIDGKKPDNKNISEQYTTLDSLKSYFGKSNMSRINDENVLDTPDEVGGYVNLMIRKFYFGDDEGNEKDIDLEPSPEAYNPIEERTNQLL